MMIKVFGIPAPKGSMKCVGSRGGRNHQLVEDYRPHQKAWRHILTQAGKKALAKRGSPYDGPVIVEACFTVPRPKSVPLARREWPTTRSSGDSDKLLRLALDALTDSGLIGDDSIVVYATTSKTYPDTPGAPDRLDRPGAIIRIEELNADPT